MARQQATALAQQQEIQALIAHLQAQESQLQKVSALLEVDTVSLKLAVNE